MHYRDMYLAQPSIYSSRPLTQKYSQEVYVQNNKETKGYENDHHDSMK
jgi:hypothetical protein